MIHIIVATISEARPFIVFYKLKKKSRIKEFDIYENSKKNLSLTISGIGKLSAAIATCYTFVEYEKKRNQIWLNFGITNPPNSAKNDPKPYGIFDRVLDRIVKDRGSIWAQF